MKRFTSNSQRTGELGEHIAVRFLKERGFDVIERNYTRKWGEIDVIVRKKDTVHFIEVKSVSCNNIDDIDEINALRPEEQMHSNKQERLGRTISTYIEGGSVGKWRFGLVCVFIDRTGRRAKVRTYMDMILSGK